MEKWEQLRDVFKTKLGITNVYYQPPADVQLYYPCVIFSRTGIPAEHANNKIYKFKTRYQVILIDKSPESEFLIPLLHLPLCSFDRHYTAKNLNHDAFNIYY